MSVVPKNLVELIQFCEDHAAAWSSVATQIGLTAADVSELETLAGTSRTVYSAATAARESSKAATTTFHNATATLRDKVAAMVKEIRTYAESTGNPQVFALAQIPMPTPPSPVPPPEKPDQFSAEVLPTGGITITFRATTPRGAGATVYLVKRRLTSLGETTFTVIGATGTERGGRRGLKAFTDTTIPFGANPAEYIVQGQRGSTLGPESNVFSITFGTGPGLQAGVQTELKMAA